MGTDIDNALSDLGRLEAEVDGLRQAMRTRGVIEQAKGVLSERFGIDPEEAYRRLSELSQHTNTRVVELAAEVVGSVSDEDSEGASPIAIMERLGSLGWARWTPHLTPLVWSTGLYTLTGRDPSQGPGDLGSLLAGVARNQRSKVDSLVRAVAAGANEGSATYDQPHSRSVRSILVVATPLRAPDGSVHGIDTVFQDLTDRNRRDERARLDARRLADERVQAATQRATTEQLRRAFFPPPRTELRPRSWLILARHLAPSRIQDFRGDFYDVDADDSSAVLTVGDIFGRGAEAATAMVRIRYAARALTRAGFAPAEVLRLLNEELCREDEPPLASVLVARVRLDRGMVTWAQAGHYSPLLLRAERMRALRRPQGGALGLRPDTGYTDATGRLEAGDLLVLFTDGAIDRSDTSGHPTRKLAADLLAAYNSGGAELAIERPRPTDDEACVIVLQVPRTD